MTIAALVVDDEPLARAGLRLLLEEDPDIASVREAPSGQRALEMIRDAPPDLVFLDVQMPEVDGFAVVRGLASGSMPVIVFVTAHDQYAVRAFEVNALDYLLKPVTRDRFKQTLARAKSHLGTSGADVAGQMQGLLAGVATPSAPVSRLVVRGPGRVLFVALEQIDWIEAAENYVELHCGAVRHLMHATMATLEASLDPQQFARVHRSIIVNVSRVTGVEPATHGESWLTLTSGARLKSGRTYSARVRALLT